MKISALCAFLIAPLALCAAYRFEGVYDQPDGDRRFFLLRLFTPYNPQILGINCPNDAPQTCAYWWPNGTYHSLEQSRSQKYDIVWVEGEGAEFEIIQSLSDVLQKTSALYTSTRPETTFPSLRGFLETLGFTLLSHWYWEGEQGNAIFLRKEIFDAAMRTLNCAPTAANFVDRPSSHNLERYFRKVGQKPGDHAFGPIDFLYMINLDERPEKFSQAAGGLELYGISPYRFSAVNGWKLSLNALEEIGVKFSPGTLKDTFMGSVYHEVDGVQYRSNEFIQEDGRTYYSMGLSQGSIGIVLSHLSVLQDAYDSGYQTIWVMEDDVEAVDDPHQIPHLIRTLDTLAPDWDILFTDTDTKDIHGNHVPCRALAAKPNFCIETRDAFLGRFYPISHELSRIGMRYGAYSMIVRRTGMEKILKHIKSYGIFLPYDMDFWLVPGIKMYTVNKDIVSHVPGALSDNNLPNYLDKKR